MFSSDLLHADANKFIRLLDEWCAKRMKEKNRT